MKKYNELNFHNNTYVPRIEFLFYIFMIYQFQNLW